MGQKEDRPMKEVMELIRAAEKDVADRLYALEGETGVHVVQVFVGREVWAEKGVNRLSNLRFRVELPWEVSKKK